MTDIYDDLKTVNIWVGDNSRAVPDAKVAIIRNTYREEGTTDLSGKATFYALSPGAYIANAVLRDKLLGIIEVRVSADGPSDFVINSHPKQTVGALVVRVRDKKGRPVTDASVTVTGPVTRTSGHFFSGDVRFSQLPAGWYRVSVFGGVSHGFVSTSTAIQIHAGKTGSAGLVLIDSSGDQAIEDELRLKEATLREKIKELHTLISGLREQIKEVNEFIEAHTRLYEEHRKGGPNGGRLGEAIRVQELEAQKRELYRRLEPLLQRKKELEKQLAIVLREIAQSSK